MRLELVLLPDAMNRVSAHTLIPSQSASAPVRRSLGLGLKRRFDNASYVSFAVNGFATSAWRDVPNATDSLLLHPSPPQSGRASL